VSSHRCDASLHDGNGKIAVTSNSHNMFALQSAEANPTPKHSDIRIIREAVATARTKPAHRWPFAAAAKPMDGAYHKQQIQLARGD
jgi:hypothetical protein